MSTTDYLQLNNHKLFEKLRKSLPKDIIKTQNVLTVNDGVLYVWDFEDHCVLTLNVKETRIRDNTSIQYQVLLPTSPSRFSVDLLRVNTTNTLLIVAGSGGVLVFELPERCPPYGGFANNKEIVYCRSHSLDEHLLLCNPSIEVRQVRFHPASLNNTHILVLTSDNVLRLYNIVNGSAVSLGLYSVGQRPKGVMPGSKTFFLGLFGETAIDFDFGPPEVSEQCLKVSENDQTGILQKFEQLKVSGTKLNNNYSKLQWPVYLLDGLGTVFFIMINLNDKTVPRVKGPLPICPSHDQNYTNDACAILCQPSTPPILCIATNNGTISHSIVLPVDANSDKLKRLKVDRKYCDVPDRAMFVLEILELELGLATTDTLSDYCCPVFLHADESRLGHYFATHEAGVHGVTVPAIDTLAQVVNGPDDENLMEHLLTQHSSAEYLLCTKTSSSNKINPVIGFSLYYDPTSTITLLGEGQVISTVMLSFTSLPYTEDFLSDNIVNFNSPLKKMLSEPFDMHIYKILKQASSQPILKLSQGENHTQQECYELLQRTSKVFREEYFKHYDKAREEIEKRAKVLQMLKNYQTGEIQKIMEEKQNLQQKAEDLAEKYEDIKDKQETLTKRCEKLLFLVAQKKKEPSDAEIKFTDDLKNAQDKIKSFLAGISRIKSQSKYQELQMENWRKELIKKGTGLASIQSQTIRTNLQDMTNQITEMIDEVVEYKKQLGLN
ncbi:hypothetical protein RN001_010590 [Aquatica leii]|uniref:Nucleoporin 88 n=1 Tax=Aquatica leii TaxID=1421715 RepID=A0AAN7SG43_9COLE|nr:hypothetical protein RN001_010590 [Aquatica leii]